MEKNGLSRFSVWLFCLAHLCKCLRWVFILWSHCVRHPSVCMYFYPSVRPFVCKLLTSFTSCLRPLDQFNQIWHIKFPSMKECYNKGPISLKERVDEITIENTWTFVEESADSVELNLLDIYFPGWVTTRKVGLCFEQFLNPQKPFA